MAGSDVMRVCTGSFVGGLISFRGGFFSVDTMLQKAKDLQASALAYKAKGDYAKAVALYRELIPFLDKLDELKAFSLPRGLQTQVAKRAIEQLEEACPGSRTALRP